MPARLLGLRGVALGDEDRLRVVRRLGEHAAERVGDERAAPELDAVAAPPGVASWPTRLHAATYTPFAIACERCMVRHASHCAAPYSARFSAGCQPIAVG